MVECYQSWSLSTIVLTVCLYLLCACDSAMMMRSFICSCRNKKEEPSSIYTLRKVRTIRGLFLLGGRLSLSGPCFSPFCKVRTHPGLARVPILCSHFPRGNEHVITCLARVFLASCTALELIHEPRNSRLSPSLRKNSAAQVVAAGFSHLSAS